MSFDFELFAPNYGGPHVNFWLIPKVKPKRFYDTDPREGKTNSSSHNIYLINF